MTTANWVIMIASGVTAFATIAIAIFTWLNFINSKKTDDLLQALVVSNMVHGGIGDSISVKIENFKKYYKGREIF